MHRKTTPGLKKLFVWLGYVWFACMFVETNIVQRHLTATQEATAASEELQKLSDETGCMHFL